MTSNTPGVNLSETIIESNSGKHWILLDKSRRCISSWYTCVSYHFSHMKWFMKLLLKKHCTCSNCDLTFACLHCRKKLLWQSSLFIYSHTRPLHHILPYYPLVGRISVAFSNFQVSKIITIVCETTFCACGCPNISSNHCAQPGSLSRTVKKRWLKRRPVGFFMTAITISRYWKSGMNED